MGIRGLAHQLESYRTVISYARSTRNDEAADDAAAAARTTSSVKRNCIVIDGPALAYHAYHTALSYRSHARNALEAIPSYGEVNDIALGMLHTLQNHGLEISAIFFDGALPEIKADVRMQRLNQYLHQMQSYRSVHSASPNGNLNIRITADGDSNATYRERPSDERLFNNRLQVPAKLQTLPASPFMVASVIEALQACQYRCLTAVIPGEADNFCAAYARHHGAIILTSDSDLLAYDLGPDSSVAMVKDVEISNGPAGTLLRIARYETASIAKGLGLQTLSPFAFAVNEDSHKTRTQYISRAKVLQDNPTVDYVAFTAEHSTGQFSESGVDVSLLSTSTLGQLDPRTAEWVYAGLDPAVHEFPTGLHSLLGSVTASQPTRMYLPVLIEDTNRASAWDASVEFRVLAYSMLRPSGANTLRTTEVARRGNRIAEISRDHIQRNELEVRLQSLQDSLEQMSALEINQKMHWPLFSLHQFCKHLVDENKPLPSRYALKALLTGQRFFEWDHVQWAAQIQGIAYSLRMLYQCIKVCLSSKIMRDKDSQTSSYRNLLTRLETMPSIQEWLDEATPEVQANAVEESLDVLYHLLGINIDEYQEASSSMSSKARKKKRKREREKERKASKGVTSSSNMFSLLANDMR